MTTTGCQTPGNRAASHPVDPYDSINDPDSDDPSNLAEYKRGTNPLMPDTDGDGMMNDGAELKVSRPLVVDQTNRPGARRGADNIGFTGARVFPHGHAILGHQRRGRQSKLDSERRPVDTAPLPRCGADRSHRVGQHAGMAPGDYTGQITFNAKRPKVRRWWRPSCASSNRLVG
jgi:hypothetical protein